MDRGRTTIPSCAPRLLITALRRCIRSRTATGVSGGSFNLLLMRDGYVPALLLRDWRVSYLQGLAAADRGHSTPLANLVGCAVEQGLDR